MSHFYIEKQIIVGHGDGWRHVLSIYDEPPLIKIEYQEWREEEDSKGWVTINTMEAFWSENAILVGKAFIELGELIQSLDTKPTIKIYNYDGEDITDVPF